MAIEKKNSRGAAKKEFDSVDMRLRKAFRAWLAQEQQKNPQLFSFLEDDDTEILKSLLRRKDKRKREEEGTSMKCASSSSDELPSPFKEKIQEMKGCEVKLVMQKKLYESDLNPNQNHACFSIKIANNFLTQKEESFLEENKMLAGMHVIVLDPSLRDCNMCFMKGSRSCFYNLTNGWNQIVLQNDLKLHDILQLWSFRVSSCLWFALVKL
ncbi:B3 domain-containing protein [Glycine soja]|nr:hypothetical protein JHK87_038552 [Glycine soja]KAG4961915.1 hypothetical protein JHK86_038783 [Glycine max]KAH1092778.1 hypothetical protein GYH30_038806 [Glycine max]